jgi:hypothetical protein
MGKNSRLKNGNFHSIKFLRRQAAKRIRRVFGACAHNEDTRRHDPLSEDQVDLTPAEENSDEDTPEYDNGVNETEDGAEIGYSDTDGDVLDDVVDEDGAVGDDVVERNDVEIDSGGGDDVAVGGEETTQHEGIYEDDGTESVADDHEGRAKVFATLLVDLGLPSYMSGTLGGCKPSKNIISTLKQAENAFEWTYFHKNKSRTSPSKNEARAWILQFITTEVNMIPQFAQYLEQTRKLKPASVLHYLNAIIVVCKWYVLFCDRDDASNSHLTPSDLVGVERVVKVLRRSYNKANQAHIRSSKSVEEMVFSKRMPQPDFGYDLLKDAVHDGLAWAIKLTSADVSIRKIYNQFMGILFASMYILSVNGRLGGILDVKFWQGESLLTNGHALTRNFKTCATYTYQPVIIDEKVAAQLLHLYINVIRPTSLFAKLKDGNSPLWVKFDGSPWDSTSMGSVISKFFEKNVGLHLNTTTLRSLMETQADELYRSGKISTATRTSVYAINGHSEQTAQNVYVKRSQRTAEVQQSRNIFSEADDGIAETITIPASVEIQPPSEAAMMNTANENFAGDLNFDFDFGIDQISACINESASTTRPTANDLVCHQFTTPNTSPQTGHRITTPYSSPQTGFKFTPRKPQKLPVWSDLDWGSEHPCVNAVYKAKWTDEELDYIANLCNKLTVSHKEVFHRLASMCRDAILRDPEAVPIFHRFHVQDSSRIRHGVDVWKKKNNLSESVCV